MAISTAARVKSSTLYREICAQCVLGEFEGKLPDRLICFLADEDWPPFKEQMGAANRGFYAPLPPKGNFSLLWPEELKDSVWVESRDSPFPVLEFDHLIYLHGSTCESGLGLSMALAHELQHVVQRMTARRLWAANTLIHNLPREAITKLRLTWSDIPIEREARVISKQIVEKLFGMDDTRQFIDAKIQNAVDPADLADWKFIRAVEDSLPYDLEAETRAVFQRMRRYRREFESLLRELSHDSDFSDLNLDALFASPIPAI